MSGERRILAGRIDLALDRLDDAGSRVARDLASDRMGKHVGSNPHFLLAHDVQNALAQIRAMLTGEYDVLIPEDSE